MGCLKLHTDQTTDLVVLRDTKIVSIAKSEKNAYRRLELSNHLGNVLATISDYKSIVVETAIDPITQQIIITDFYYEAVVLTVSDYDTFGQKLDYRSFSSGDYRFGFNGKETDSETDLQDYGFRIYNPALGRFLSVDPLTKDCPWNSVYAFAENDVIRCIDLDGLEKVYYFDEDREKYLGFNKALHVLGETGILDEIIMTFSNANSDVYIIVEDLNDEDCEFYHCPEGTTDLFSLWEKSESAEDIVKIDVASDYMSMRTDGRLKALEDNTLNLGRNVIIVAVDLDLVNEAANNNTKLVDLCEAIGHEMECHVTDDIDGTDDVDEITEHEKFYDSTFDNDSSPKTDDIKPNSKAGKMLTRIKNFIYDKKE